MKCFDVNFQQLVTICKFTTTVYIVKNVYEHTNRAVARLESSFLSHSRSLTFVSSVMSFYL